MGPRNQIQIISEPEAAATYALDALDPHDVRVDDTFVLCDAGGGTVDLISYTVSQLRPMLKIEEAASGTGGLCGSTYLNRIFEQFLIAKFGQNEGWEDDVIEEASSFLNGVSRTDLSRHPKDSRRSLSRTLGLRLNGVADRSFRLSEDLLETRMSLSLYLVYNHALLDILLI